MFIKKEKIKESVNNLIKNHGIIKKIRNDSGKLIGYFVRTEIKNDPECVMVGLNISFNKKYLMNSKINNSFFYPGEYKYFAIEHLSKSEEKISQNKFIKTCDLSEFNFDTLNELYQNYYLDWCHGSNETENNKILEFIFTSIKNIENYYKNKKIIIFFI
jgi:hypothetical protein